MKKVAVVVSILVLALASVGLAQPRGAECPKGGDGPGFGPGHRMMGGGPGCGMHQGMRGRMGGGFGEGMGVRMILNRADELKLTDQQKNKLEGMIADFQTESIDAKAALEKAHVELGDLMRRDAAESDVISGIDKVARLRADMQKMQYRHHQQVKGVLTADQVKQLKDMRKNFGKRMFQRWNNDDDDNSGPGSGRRGGRG